MLSGIIEFCEKIVDRTSLNNSVVSWQNNVTIDSDVMIYWILLFVLLLLLSAWLLSNRKTARVLDSISNNLLVISFLIWLMGVILYIVGYYRPELNWLSVIPRSVISSFKMFVVTNELARVDAGLQNDAVYMSLFSTVHFAAAFITFLFIFKMVGYKVKSSLKIILHKWFKTNGKVVHLFWGVDEASCLLAEDIRRKHSDDTIIFIDVDIECEDDTKRKATLSNIFNAITIKNSEVVRLESIDALVDHCFNGPAAFKSNDENDIFGLLHLKNVGAILQKSIRSYIYFLSEDESQNVAGALNLQKDKMICTMTDNKPVLYIHARRDANNEVLDHYSQYEGVSRSMKIKLIDSSYLSVTALKQDERTLPVSCVNVENNTGFVNAPFTSLIIGFGATGQEAFKFLYEYSTFLGSDLERTPFRCFAVDEKMNRIAGLVREKMPAIGEDELSLVQATVDSSEFWKLVRSIVCDLNYVVISLNNDSTGLALAVNLFKYALQNRQSHLPLLKIMVRCYDNANEKRMSEVTESLNQSVKGENIELSLFGMNKDIYSCDTILSDLTLIEAKEFNKVYEGSEKTADDQWKINFGDDEVTRLMVKKGMSRYHAIHDINRRIAQNMSNSMHGRTKMLLMGFGTDGSLERLKKFNDYVNSREEGSTRYNCSEEDAQLLLNMAKVEHERWIASHKLMGYTYSSESDNIKKYNKFLCPWEDLDELTQSYDCNVVDTTIKIAFRKVF